jgi:serine kinase of HPr protein (carbohydrate metabolism regulator)
MIAVFKGLLRIGFIEVTQEGYYDRVTLQGGLTRFVARDELLERLLELDGHPATSIKHDMDAETIILRNNVDGKKALQEYEDTPATERYRSNLKKINSCFLNHWCDLEVQDTEVTKLEARIANHATKEPIDFSQRTLVRIFSNGSFQAGWTLLSCLVAECP